MGSTTTTTQSIKLLLVVLVTIIVVVATAVVNIDASRTPASPGGRTHHLRLRSHKHLPEGMAVRSDVQKLGLIHQKLRELSAEQSSSSPVGPPFDSLLGGSVWPTVSVLLSLYSSFINTLTTIFQGRLLCGDLLGDDSECLIGVVEVTEATLTENAVELSVVLASDLTRCGTSSKWPTSESTK